MVPNPTPIYRLVHVDNLPIILARAAMHSPNHSPKDGAAYKTIHDVSVQAKRSLSGIPCGPGGAIHDYVPFYFGPLSVMLLKLKTGQVAGYSEGQEPLVYLTTTVQAVGTAGCRFVFSDGHGLATFSNWYDDPVHLDKVDWGLVTARYWADKPEDNDRQRRKQAEFLIWQQCAWPLISEIGVLNATAQARVSAVCLNSLRLIIQWSSLDRTGIIDGLDERNDDGNRTRKFTGSKCGRTRQYGKLRRVYGQRNRPPI